MIPGKIGERWGVSWSALVFTKMEIVAIVANLKKRKCSKNTTFL